MSTRYPADWPQGLIDIAEVIGPDLALLLAQHVGGVPSYVPKDPQNDHKLAMIIGLPALKKLSAIYSGEWLEVPKYAAAKNKKIKVRQLLNEGMSFRKTALDADVTVRYVTMVAKSVRNAGQQLSLLDI
jgi:hypothetical protein